LVVQRDARLFGSRLTPAVPTMLVAISCLTDVSSTSVFWVFLLISILSLVVLLLAPRSVFTNSGRVAIESGRGSLALVVTIAFLTVFIFIGSMIETYRWSRVRERAWSAFHRIYSVKFGPEGQPWLGREDYSWQHGSHDLTQVARMESGRSVRDQLRPVAEDWQKTPHWAVDTSYQHLSRGFWTRFTHVASASSSGPAGFVQRAWVFDHKSHTILFYHHTMSDEWQLAQRIQAPPSVGSFGELKEYGQTDPYGNFTLVTSTGAFYVPGDGSAIITLYQAPTSSTILGSHELTRDEDEPFAMMLRLADRVVLVESDLDRTAASQARSIGEAGNHGSLYVTEIQVPNELAAFESLSIARDPLRDGTYLGLAQRGRLREGRMIWARFDADGQIAAQQEYTENFGPDVVYGESIYIATFPPGVWTVVFSSVLVTTDDFPIETMWKNAKEDVAGTARAVLLFLLQPIVGVPLAIWAARRRRLDKRRTWFCIVWGFLLGPAGSLSILAVYPRIARDRCVACQQATRIDLDHCEHCDHPAADVPRIGIEIFDRDQQRASQPAEATSLC